MDTIGALFHGFAIALTPGNLLAVFLGAFIGTVIGVLPGLGPTATLALLLPITIGMDMVTALIMMAGIYYGAMYGGSTTSILVNIPGEAASVVTCIDGYQMARQGRAGPALGMSAFGSFIGGTISVVAVMLISPFLAETALKFGAPEMFALLFFAFTCIGGLTGKSTGAGPSHGVRRAAPGDDRDRRYPGGGPVRLRETIPPGRHRPRAAGHGDLRARRDPLQHRKAGGNRAPYWRPPRASCRRCRTGRDRPCPSRGAASSGSASGSSRAACRRWPRS